MSIALGFFVITYFLKFYGEVSVAAFGVGTRIEQIALLPAIGLSSAIVSIVGQNNGAGETERVRECVRLCFKYGLYLIVTASVLLFVFATPLVRLFTNDPAVIEVGTKYVRIVTFIQWSYVSGFVYIGFLQALKRPMYGFVESFTRKIILPGIVFTSRRSCSLTSASKASGSPCAPSMPSWPSSPSATASTSSESCTAPETYPLGFMRGS